MLGEISTHNTQSSCYTAIVGKGVRCHLIYNHPGGHGAILNMYGKDSTSTFMSQYGGQSKSEQVLASFKIGTLVQ